MRTSSDDTASSQMISAGLRATARAMATRWAWPPDSSRGRLVLCPARPTSSSTSSTRRRLAVLSPVL